MKNRLLICSLAATLLAGITPALSAEPKTAVKCTEVIAKLESEIAKDPSRVLLAMEDALLANDSCACEIIKATITVSRADAKLVGEIVAAAINATPTVASTIGECALAAAPQASSEIKTALQNALGQGDSAGKEPIGSGKEPVSVGKEIVTAPPVVSTDGDFAIAPVSVTGIYFSAPAGGSSISKETETIIKVIRSCDCRAKKKPHTGSTPVTDS
jgi:hypothetical protein